jgi:hypothetical protein
MESSRNSTRGLPGALWAAWAALMLVCTVWYWPGLTSWFQGDDFVWMHLRAVVHGWRDLPDALFRPNRLGTARFLSERIYFLAVQALWGPSAAAFHAIATVTWAASVLLLMGVAHKLFRSVPAALAAGLVWALNPATATALGWIATFNQILLGFFFTLAFYLLLDYLETGRRAFLVAVYAALILGFGAYEIMAVFPAVAIAYVLLSGRRLHWDVAGLLVPSAVFTAIHAFVIPAVKSGPYLMHYDAGILRTTLRYWALALGVKKAVEFQQIPFAVAAVWVSLVTLALLLLAGAALRRRGTASGDGMSLFGAVWFVVALAPILPLRDHFIDYYAYLPAAGLALLCASLLRAGAPGGRLGRIAVWGGLAVYVAFSLPSGDRISRWFHERGELSRAIVMPVVDAAHAQPGRSIFLAGLNSDQFMLTVGGWPFSSFGVERVWLTPDSRQALSDLTGREDQIAEFLASQSTYDAEMRVHHARTFAFTQGRMRETTEQALAALGGASNYVASVQIGDPDYARFLGAGWYGAEGGSRWMAGRAELQLSVPRSTGQHLVARVYCPRGVYAGGPLLMTASAGGKRLATVPVARPDEVLELAWALPGELAGQEPVAVVLELNRTYRAKDDPRELGIVVSRVEIR